MSVSCRFVLSASSVGVLSACLVSVLSACLVVDLFGHVNTSSKPASEPPCQPAAQPAMFCRVCLVMPCRCLVGVQFCRFCLVGVLSEVLSGVLSEALSRTRLSLKWGRHLEQGLGQGPSTGRGDKFPPGCPLRVAHFDCFGTDKLRIWFFGYPLLRVCLSPLI